jgi:predicted RNA-binding protein YlqC (UPF0109 family)
MRELIELLARSLVDSPDEVSVTEVEDEQSVTVELKVDSSDMGRIIGKQGKIARAIRILAKAAATKSGKKVQVEIVS